MDLKWQFLFVVVPLTILQGLNCASWSSSLKDGQVMYACAGKTLTLPWQLNLTSGQTINDIQWYFHGQSEEMIAILSHGHFMPMPAFGQRVTQTGNAGIEISHLTLGDTGNYSVEVSVQDTSGVLIPVRQTLYVHVSDGLMTTDGRLHASLLSQPVLDSSSQQFALVLTCGHFTYVGQPPFDVQWTNPSGNTLLSSTYAGGFFQLHLPSPVSGGTYSCQIPPSSAVAACLPAATEVKVNVDETAARLSLLEASLAQQQDLDTRQSQHIHDLEANQTALREVDTQQKALLSQQGQRIHDLEDVQLPSLKNQVNSLNQQLHDMASNQVSFLAKLGVSLTTPSTSAAIVFGTVVNNLGNGYSATTGYFTAPYAGSYFFAITTRCGNSDTYYGDAKIMSDNHEVCNINSYVHSDAGSCQGVAHLRRGQRVWVEPLVSDACFYEGSTFFTGFLISMDP